VPATLRSSPCSNGSRPLNATWLQYWCTIVQAGEAGCNCSHRASSWPSRAWAAEVKRVPHELQHLRDTTPNLLEQEGNHGRETCWRESQHASATSPPSMHAPSMKNTQRWYRFVLNRVNSSIVVLISLPLFLRLFMCVCVCV